VSGRSRIVLLGTAALLAGAPAGCGDGGPNLSAAQREGQAAVARRHIPQGITLAYTETAPAPQSRRPATFAAGKIACGDWRAKYVAYAYGRKVIGAMTPADLDRTAHAFAVGEAAPGRVEVVQRGCRAGLDTPAAR
jgi:hypothetical protein